MLAAADTPRPLGAYPKPPQMISRDAAGGIICAPDAEKTHADLFAWAWTVAELYRQLENVEQTLTTLQTALNGSNVALVRACAEVAGVRDALDRVQTEVEDLRAGRERDRQLRKEAVDARDAALLEVRRIRAAQRPGTDDAILAPWTLVTERLPDLRIRYRWECADPQEPEPWVVRQVDDVFSSWEGHNGGEWVHFDLAYEAMLSLRPW